MLAVTRRNSLARVQSELHSHFSFGCSSLAGLDVRPRSTAKSTLMQSRRSMHRHKVSDLVHALTRTLRSQTHLHSSAPASIVLANLRRIDRTVYEGIGRDVERSSSRSSHWEVRLARLHPTNESEAWRTPVEQHTEAPLAPARLAYSAYVVDFFFSFFLRYVSMLGGVRRGIP